MTQFLSYCCLLIAVKQLTVLVRLYVDRTAGHGSINGHAGTSAPTGYPANCFFPGNKGIPQNVTIPLYKAYKGRIRRNHRRTIQRELLSSSV